MKAVTTVHTPKAARYLKALCNHFNRKVQATYTETHGTVAFGFGHCEMDADEQTLTIRIEAATDEDFARVQYVVADHLERFAAGESLQLAWVEA